MLDLLSIGLADLNRGDQTPLRKNRLELTLTLEIRASENSSWSRATTHQHPCPQSQEKTKGNREVTQHGNTMPARKPRLTVYHMDCTSLQPEDSHRHGVPRVLLSGQPHHR